MTRAKEQAIVWWSIIVLLVGIWALIIWGASEALGQESTHIVPADEAFQMQWAPGTGSEGYEVEKATGAGAYIKTDEVSTEQLEDTLTDLQSARYRVRGFRGATTTPDGILIPRQVGPYSDPSDRIVGVTMPGKPGKPGVVP
jgi:hypothetical protein